MMDFTTHTLPTMSLSAAGPLPPADYFSEDRKMKTSQLFTIEVNKLGPNEALAELVYYFICRYGLSTVTRHIRQIDAATDAVISKTAANF